MFSCLSCKICLFKSSLMLIPQKRMLYIIESFSSNSSLLNILFKHSFTSFPIRNSSKHFSNCLFNIKSIYLVNVKSRISKRVETNNDLLTSSFVISNEPVDCFLNALSHRSEFIVRQVLSQFRIRSSLLVLTISLGVIIL